MQQTELPVAPSVTFASTPDTVGIVALDDETLGQVVGGVAMGPGAGWFVCSGPGNGW